MRASCGRPAILQRSRLVKKDVTEGSKYLARAVEEARTANGLDDDDRAAIASLQGWQAQFNGDYTVSMARYRQAHGLNVFSDIHHLSK